MFNCPSIFCQFHSLILYLFIEHLSININCQFLNELLAILFSSSQIVFRRWARCSSIYQGTIISMNRSTCGSHERQSWVACFDCYCVSFLQLVKMIQPRLILDGHKHYSCETEYGGVPERTVAPFSWHSRNQPSFMLVRCSTVECSTFSCALHTANRISHRSRMRIFRIFKFSRNHESQRTLKISF